MRREEAIHLLPRVSQHVRAPEVVELAGIHRFRDRL
jgi:hypothetical protein